MNFKNVVLRSVAGAATLLLANTFSANAAPPPEDSPQWKLLHPYSGFITRMHTPGQGWCCDWSDGRGDMPERRVPGSDGKKHYQVFAMQKAYDSTYAALLSQETYNGEKGKWIDIPERAVLAAEDAEKQCEDVRDGKDVYSQGKPSQDQKDTCEAPMFNILWINTSGGVYCYWPVPKLGALEQKQDIKLASAERAPRPTVN